MLFIILLRHKRRSTRRATDLFGVFVILTFGSENKSNSLIPSQRGITGFPVEPENNPSPLLTTSS